jgi:hypothetical membrane protein
VNTKFLSPRLGAISGLIGAAVFTVLWIAAAQQDGGWMLGKMTLSELGDRSRPGAALFNAGAIIAGILSFIFSIGLYRVLSTSVLGRAGSVVMGLASLFLMGVGLFPIDTGTPHTIVSIGFFTLGAVAMAMIVMPAWRSHVLHPSGGLLTAILLIIALVGLVALSLPAAEALAVGCLLLWTALISIRMLWHHPAP